MPSIRFAAHSLHALATAILGLEAGARAQGPQPFVAPIVTNADASRLADIRSKASWYFAPADGKWDFGEGFDASTSVDVGGFHGFDDGSNVGIANVQQPPGFAGFGNAWLANTNLRNFIGYLAPRGATISAFDAETAFEIILPADFPNSSRQPVLVISVFPTIGDGSNSDGHPVSPSYPGRRYDPATGKPYVDGLRHVGSTIDRPWPWGDELAARSLTSGYDIIDAYIVPSVGGRPLLFSMQRNLQLLAAVKAVLAQSFNFKAPLPVVVAGSSFGGLVAQAMVIHHPDRVHAGLSHLMSGSMHRIVDDQDFLGFLGSLTGLNGGGGYEATDALDWNAHTTQYGTDFVGTSLTDRFKSTAAADRLSRPFYFVVGDEDLVTHGDDWLPLIAGSPYADHGTAAANGIQVHWSIIKKMCHEATKPYVLANGTPSANPNDAVAFMLPQAVASFGGPMPPPPSRTIKNPNATLDPQDEVLARRPLRTIPPGKRQAEFNEHGELRAGDGTWLGARESLVIAKDDPTATRSSIFVGSADGIVTKFAVGRDTSGRPYLERLATSIELGFGAWALAVDDIDGNPADIEVVVGTHRALFVLRATDLSVRWRTPDWYEADDRHTGPSHLTLADMLPSVPGKEIVFATPNGGLFVLPHDLSSVLTELPETGILDIVIGPRPPRLGKGTLGPPIYFLSARHHVCCVELSLPGVTPAAFLRAVSPLVHGGLNDLEWLPSWPGQSSRPVLVALSAEPWDLSKDQNGPGTEPSIQVLDEDLLDGGMAGGGRGVRGVTDANVPGNAVDMAFSQTGNTLRIVEIANGFVYVLDAQGNVIGKKDLTTFPAAVQPLCVQVGNLVDGPGFDGDEVVLSTQPGRVVWFNINELIGGTTTIGPIANPLQRSNDVLTATWGMDAEVGASPRVLHLADQTGAHFLATQTSYAFKNQLMAATLFGATLPVTAPIRDLRVAHTTNGLFPFAGTRYLATKSTLAPGLVGSSAWTLPVARVDGAFYTPIIAALNLCDDLWIFPFGGDVAQIAAARYRTYWWCASLQSGFRPYQNLLQRAEYGFIYTGEGAIDDASVRASSGTYIDQFTKPASFMDLRNELGLFEPLFDMQSVRLCHVKDQGDQVVISTSGGVAAVIDDATFPSVRPPPQAPLLETEDLGFGGMALAVAPIKPGLKDTIALGVAMAPSDRAGSPIAAAVGIFRWSNGQLVREPFPAAVGHAVCGLAITDIDPYTPGAELVVTTLDGELFVFQALAPGFTTFDPQPIYAKVFGGALGAFNSIVTADLNGDGKPELYIAGTQGVLRIEVP